MESSSEVEVNKIKQEPGTENAPEEMNLGTNILIDENAQILEMTNMTVSGSNVTQIFFDNAPVFDMSNFGQNEIVVNDSEDIIPVSGEETATDAVTQKNKPSGRDETSILRKELTLLQEKFTVLHAQVQNQSKLIELLIRMDIVKESNDSDQIANKEKEIEDLRRKINMCSSLVEESNIKYKELCNEKRRPLLPAPHEPEKKAAIWDHFTFHTDLSNHRTAECNYCGKVYVYKHVTTQKAKEHITEKCERAPENLKVQKIKPLEPEGERSKSSVWSYFFSKDRNGKTYIVCMFCGIEYSSKNATKCREHLAFKCLKVEQEAQQLMKATFSQEFIAAVTNQKRSTIWEHYNIIEEDDKTVIQCIYCCMSYANKNATKCREHLLERCDKIPIMVRHRISNSFYDSPLKTWTQVKIPIWKHFSAGGCHERLQYRCNYCTKSYTSKNVTKFRIHLLSKCTNIPSEVRQELQLETMRASTKGGTIDCDNGGAITCDENSAINCDENNAMDCDEGEAIECEDSSEQKIQIMSDKSSELSNATHE